MVLQKGRKEDKIRHLGVRGRREGRGDGCATEVFSGLGGHTSRITLQCLLVRVTVSTNSDSKWTKRTVLWGCFGFSN